jgi:hypothetical protein
MLNNFRLNTDVEYTKKAAENVATTRGNDQRRNKLSNLLGTLKNREEKLSSLNSSKLPYLVKASNNFSNVYGSQDSTDEGSDYSSNGSTTNFDLETFQMGYSKDLKKISDKYKENLFIHKNIFNTDDSQYCNELKTIGEPIYINTIIKGKHFSVRVAQEISEEIDIHLQSLQSYLPTEESKKEEQKLRWIKYALCTCTKDKTGKKCDTRGIDVKSDEFGGKRRKNKKTKKNRRRKSSKKRRHTRRR